MSSVTHCNDAPSKRHSYFPWRDAAAVIAVTLLSALVFARIDLSETLFATTRGWEHLQIDELPVTLLVLAASLGWFAWRRYKEMRAELRARQGAESRLALLLQDHRRLTQQHVELQESERKALARELHDELGQYLNAIKTDAVAIQVRATHRDAQMHRAASAVIAHCDHLQETVRNLIGQLRPVGLDILGLRAALEHYIEVVRQSTPQRQLRLRMEGELDDLDDAASLALYRLIQEGLTNVSRHAGARSVEITIERRQAETDEVAISLCDDGRGANPEAKTLGLGLLGMRERIEMLDGTFEIRTAPGKGFAIHAFVPVARRNPCAPMKESVGAGISAGHRYEHEPIGK